jgi:nickel transport protein
MPTLRLIAIALAALLACHSPVGAFDLFATHEVTVQFAASDGRPLADADVQVFAPGDLTHPVKRGKTDKDGKFVFGTDRDGLWTAEAKVEGEVARATVRVGGGANEGEQSSLSPIIVIGGLLVLLVIAVWYRFLRARTRRRGG